MSGGTLSATGTIYIDDISAASVAALALPGDYNRNGVVDAADYVAWRKTDGTQAGYDTWRTHFGQPPGPGTSANATVPEPATLLLLLSLVAGAWMQCRASSPVPSTR